MNTTVIIGRLQPPHPGHADLIEEALRLNPKAIVLIGSSAESRSLRNPFSGEERLQMLRHLLAERNIDPARISIGLIGDHHAAPHTWLAEVEQAAASLSEPGDTFTLLQGRAQRLPIPQGWTNHLSRIDPTSRAQEARSVLLGKERSDERLETLLGPRVSAYILQWRESAAHTWLTNEHAAVTASRAAWNGSPYAPTFNTADSVVTCSGHLLVIRRGQFPGQGLLALPGGYVEQNETLLNAAIRELQEECGVTPRFQVRPWSSYVRAQHTFDHPERSERGRIITQAFHFDLGHAPLPRVQASSDASAALWIPIQRALSDTSNWFEDHRHIVEHFLLR